MGINMKNLQEGHSTTEERRFDNVFDREPCEWGVGRRGIGRRRQESDPPWERTSRDIMGRERDTIINSSMTLRDKWIGTRIIPSSSPPP